MNDIYDCSSFLFAPLNTRQLLEIELNGINDHHMNRPLFAINIIYFFNFCKYIYYNQVSPVHFHICFILQ